MTYFKKIRESITLAYCSNIIDNEEFVLLYDLHKSRNLDITHTDFAKFDLENHNDDQCYVNFRFSIKSTCLWAKRKTQFTGRYFMLQ